MVCWTTSKRTGRDVHVRDDDDVGRLRTCPAIVNADGFVGTLVVVADADRLKAVAQLFLHGGITGVERLLVAPHLEHHEVPGPADLLEQLDADETVLLGAGVAILLEERDGLP
jgi:hypothetical protein